MWRTEDGGSSWLKVEAIANYTGVPSGDLAGLTVDYRFLNLEQGWLRTLSGVFLTLDAGRWWRNLALPSDFRDAAGQVNEVWFDRGLKTGWLGGGVHRPAPAGEVYFDNSAVDQLSRPLRVLRPAVFFTNDGGFTWQQQFLASDDYRVRLIRFLDTKHGLFLTEGSAYWTVTEGKSGLAHYFR